MARGHAAALCQ